MREKHWAGVGALVLGALICAWQVYEVRATDHFTFWMVKWVIPLPVPVIALGGIFLFAGVIILVEALYPGKDEGDRILAVFGLGLLIGGLAWLLSTRSRYVDVGALIGAGSYGLLLSFEAIRNAMTRGEPRELGTAGRNVGNLLWSGLAGGWWGWCIEHGMWLLSNVRRLRELGIGLDWAHRLALVGIVAGLVVCVASSVSFALSGPQTRPRRGALACAAAAAVAGLLFLGPLLAALFALAGWGLGLLID